LALGVEPRGQFGALRLALGERLAQFGHPLARDFQLLDELGVARAVAVALAGQFSFAGGQLQDALLRRRRGFAGAQQLRIEHRHTRGALGQLRALVPGGVQIVAHRIADPSQLGELGAQLLQLGVQPARALVQRGRHDGGVGAGLVRRSVSVARRPTTPDPQAQRPAERQRSQQHQ